MDGLRQAREGKVKDFNAVCDRLEEKSGYIKEKFFQLKDKWKEETNNAINAKKNKI